MCYTLKHCSSHLLPPIGSRRRVEIGAQHRACPRSDTQEATGAQRAQGAQICDKVSANRHGGAAGGGAGYRKTELINRDKAT